MVTTPARAGLQWTEIRTIAALGEPLLELQPADDGGARLAVGGDVANSMICLSRMLGAKTKEISLVTALGDSSYSAWLRQWLLRAGIHIIEPSIAGEPGIYGLPLDSAGHPGFSYWRTQSAAHAFLQSADVDRFEDLLGETQLLLVTGITLALCSNGSFEHLCLWADRHRADCSVVFDCNFRRRLWDSDAQARERIGTFERLASVLATGGDDEKALWGAANPAQIIERVSKMSAEYLIRDGSEGCWVGSGGECRHVPTEPVAIVGDTAGAGDSHLAGYMAARMLGYGRADAAVYANEAAAVIVSQRGSLPKEGTRFPPLPARAPT